MAAPDRTHYDLLGISRDADAAEVRRAWRMLVQVWHPDRFDGDMRDEAERHTSCINEAYHTLRDGGRRAAYDCRLAADEADAKRAADAAAAAATPRSSARTSAPWGSSAARDAAPAGIGVAGAMAGPTDPVTALAREVRAAVARHPRFLVGAAAVWVVLFGGGALWHSVNGPSLPSGSLASAATATDTSQRIAPDRELDRLAEQARRDADEASKRLSEMMEQDSAAMEAPVPEALPLPADPAGAAVGPRAPVGRSARRVAKPIRRARPPVAPAPHVQEVTKPNGDRVLRVMPG